MRWKLSLIYQNVVENYIQVESTLNAENKSNFLISVHLTDRQTGSRHVGINHWSMYTTIEYITKRTLLTVIIMDLAIFLAKC